MWLKQVFFFQEQNSEEIQRWFLTCGGGASLEQFFHSSPDLWIYMFFFIFDFFVFFVRPKMSLLSTSTRLHLQWGLWWSDSLLSSLIQHFIFFFSSAGQTSLRGIFKEERGKTLFRHQSIKVWASEKTTAAGGHCVDYLCPSHHLFMVTMVRHSVAAGGASYAQGPVMTLDWQEKFQRLRTAKLPGNKRLVNISKKEDKNGMNKTKK